MKKIKGAIDGWQRRNRVAGPTYATVRKFSDDQANLYVVSLGWYGFTAIFPLLLVIVTIFGYIGAKSLGTGIINALHKFPVIGTELKPAHGSSTLHGSPLALVIGLVLLLYGAQGVTQIAQLTMAKIWALPKTEMPGFGARLGRSIAGLLAIGIAFVVDAYVGSVATGSGHPFWLRVVVLIGLVVFNVLAYLAAFLVLSASPAATPRTLLPGAIVGGVGFTLLTTVGTGLVEHQLKNTSATYGAMASVIGIVVYLLFLAKLSVYAAELNPVLAKHLWPRSLPKTEPTEADNRVPQELAHAEAARAGEEAPVGVRAEARSGARPVEVPPEERYRPTG
jgi:uncharacterized BrkB/YihY/UPF0761 family membrane protein